MFDLRRTYYKPWQRLRGAGSTAPLGRRYASTHLPGAEPCHGFRFTLEELREGIHGRFAAEVKLHRVALGRWPLVRPRQVGRE